MPFSLVIIGGSAATAMNGKKIELSLNVKKILI